MEREQAEAATRIETRLDRDEYRGLARRALKTRDAAYVVPLAQAVHRILDWIEAAEKKNGERSSVFQPSVEGQETEDPGPGDERSPEFHAPVVSSTEPDEIISEPEPPYAHLSEDDAAVLLAAEEPKEPVRPAAPEDGR
jgi:hypothetical protein